MSLYNQKDPITAENILTGAVNFSTSSSEDITLLVKSYLERSLTRFEQDKNLEGVSDLEKVLENTNEEPLSDFLFEARVSSYGLFGNFYLKNFKDHKNSLSSYNNSLDLIHDRENLSNKERILLYFSNAMILREALTYLDNTDDLKFAEGFINCYRKNGAYSYSLMEKLSSEEISPELIQIIHKLGAELFLGSLKSSRLYLRMSRSQDILGSKKQGYWEIATRIIEGYNNMEKDFNAYVRIGQELSGVEDLHAKKFLLMAKDLYDSSEDPKNEFHPDHLDIYEVLAQVHDISPALNPWGISIDNT